MVSFPHALFKDNIRHYICGEETAEPMLSRLFRLKSVDHILQETTETEEKLNRALTWFDLILFGMGAIIGAGIFATIGTAVAGDLERPGAGPALTLSFLLTALACAFPALCYAEFAAMVPISGSAYTYSYATLGEIIAWIIGWDLIIEYAIGNVAVAISWSGYFCDFLAGFGIRFPAWMTTDYRTALQHVNIIEQAPHLFGAPIVFNLPAVAIVALLTVLILIGIKESSRFNNLLVIVKSLVLAFFVLVGFFYIKPENYVPFAPNGWAGIHAGSAIVFFAYIGFDAVSTLAEETRDPARDLPLGIVGSLLVCTIIYILVSIVFSGIIPYETLHKMLASEKAEPLSLAIKYVISQDTGQHFSRYFLNSVAAIVAFGAVIANTAVLLVFQIGQARIFFSMSRDGLLPPVFKSVHRRFKTPDFSTIITGIFVAFFAAFMSIDEMVDLCNIGTLFAFILVCAGIIILRIKEPERKRPFRAPGGLAVPIVGIAACIALMLGLPALTWKRFFIWLIVGMFIYLSYGIRSSRLEKQRSSL